MYLLLRGSSAGHCLYFIHLFPFSACKWNKVMHKIIPTILKDLCPPFHLLSRTPCSLPSLAIVLSVWLLLCSCLNCCWVAINWSPQSLGCILYRLLNGGRRIHSEGQSSAHPSTPRHRWRSPRLVDCRLCFFMAYCIWNPGPFIVNFFIKWKNWWWWFTIKLNLWLSRRKSLYSIFGILY